MHYSRVHVTHRIERERAKSCRTIAISFTLKCFISVFLFSAPDLKWKMNKHKIKIDTLLSAFEYGGRLHCVYT